MEFESHLHQDYAHLANFLNYIEAHFSGAHPVISEGQNIIKKLPIDGIEVVVKSFPVPGVIGGFFSLHLKDSTAKQSFFNAIELEKLSIGAPRAIGYIQFIKNELLQHSFYISQYVEFEFTMKDVIEDIKFPNRITILESFAIYTQHMHASGVWHTAYDPANIAVVLNDSSVKFYLLDVMNIKFKSVAPKKGLEAFRKIGLMKDDVTIIGRTYAKHAQMDTSLNVIHKIIR